MLYPWQKKIGPLILEVQDCWVISFKNTQKLSASVIHPTLKEYMFLKPLDSDPR